MARIRNEKGIFQKGKKFQNKCIVCSKIFLVTESLRYRKYCSKNCYWVDLKILMIGKTNTLGYKFTLEQKEKLSKSKKGISFKQSKWTDERKKEHSKILKEYFKIHPKNKGKKHSKEARYKMSESKKKEKSHLWKGGITQENKIIRATLKYRIWRESVFERDNYTCQECGVRGGNLEAHHIKAFAIYPELRFEINNGVTVCILCHQKIDSMRGRFICKNG